MYSHLTTRALICYGDFLNPQIRPSSFTAQNTGNREEFKPVKTPTLRPDVAALGIVLDALDQLDEQQRVWVLQTAASRLSLKIDMSALDARSPRGDSDATVKPADAADQGRGGVSAKGFIRSKNPQSDVQRITCLAYYLTKFRNTRHFKTKELSELNAEADCPKLSNPTVAVNNARKEKYLTPAGNGNKQLTNQGEDLVEALPDQEKVRALKSKSRMRKKRVRNKR